ncbi:zinc finger CCCH domain-containing protein 55-like [Euphorbia lathyris]|uniref:zinc finger CCCH domain-containing protein 55-like n=1 Tax=Euphorbia lathyris TaxID=212925 RepID=UPI0033139A9B
MDTYEATNMLLSKIKSIDPDNASKIMGYILIQGHNENDLLSLALASEPFLFNVILKAKSHLGLSSNALSAPSSPSPLNPISRPPGNHNHNHNPFSQSSPRVTPFVDFAKNPSPHSWPASGMVANCNGGNANTAAAATSISPKSSPFLSYDNIRAGSGLVPPSPSNGGNGSGDSSNSTGDLINEYQLDEYFSFLDDFPQRNEESLDPRVQLGGYDMNNVDAHLHRRRFSESDACFGGEDGNFGHGFRPCMYFARGFCKNGESCKFVHGGFGGDGVAEVAGGGGCGVMMGSPREMEGLYLQQHEEMMRMKAAQQQRLAYNKYMNFLLQQEGDSGRMGAASLLMGDELHKFGQFRPDRDFLAMAMEEKANSASRQIYLTFPADSTFKDEDVSNYFCTFGSVQDVRIPYQQKRMFGFVTFVHPETVKLILSRGNPHFICDSRVLVKPYKEKGKVANNSRRQHHLHQQLMERGNFSPCSSPSGLDPRELYDLHLGAKMLSQEIMLRRKLEQQAELQQAIELQGRRLINLQLPDLRGDFVHHHQRSLSAGSPISMPPYASMDQNLNVTSDFQRHSVLEAEKGDRSANTICSSVIAGDQNLQHEGNAASIQCNGTVNGNVESFNSEGCNANKRSGSMVEQGLPDNPFASPRNSLGSQSDFAPGSSRVKEITESSSSENNALVSASSNDVVSHKL